MQPYQTGWVYPEPIPGLRIRTPRVAPPPGLKVIGYLVKEPKPGLKSLEHLSWPGCLLVLLLTIAFFPLLWLPCALPSCYENYQVPVYNTEANAVTAPMPAGDIVLGMPLAQPYSLIGARRSPPKDRFSVKTAMGYPASGGFEDVRLVEPPLQRFECGFREEGRGSCSAKTKGRLHNHHIV